MALHYTAAESSGVRRDTLVASLVAVAIATSHNCLHTSIFI